MASRRTQPYRRGARTRVPGGALSAMTRGRDFGGKNPQDVQRARQKAHRRRGRRRGRSNIYIKPENRGKLRAAAGAKKGQNIPLATLVSMKNSSDPAVRRRANFAINARKWHH